jgi:hypothetical protein
MDGYPVVYADDWCGDHKLGTNPSREDASIIEKTFDTVSWLANPSVVHRDV